MAILPKDAPTQRELMLAKLKRESDAEDLELGLQQAKMKREITKKELEAFKANQEELTRQEGLASGPPPEVMAERLRDLSVIADSGSTNAILGQGQRIAAARALQDDPMQQIALLTKGQADVATPDVFGRTAENMKRENPEFVGTQKALAEYAKKRKLQQLTGGA